MKTICYISHVPFWHRMNGGMERDLQLLDYLSRHFELKMAFLGQLVAEDVMAISKFSFNFKINAIGTGSESTKHDWISLFKRQEPEIRSADTYMIRGVENAYMFDALPESAVTFLDTMDLVSERSQKGTENENILSKMTREEETAIFSRFDYVICIQEDEAVLAGQWIGRDKVITAKHPVTPVTGVPKGNRSRIGLVASSWAPNAFGFRDFAINCWPTIRRTGATLDVYGTIANVLNASLPAVTFHGFVEDLDECYEGMGIIINPVQYGAGLKIKSIEAMARGLPLVTSREGASGIEQLDGHALVIANTWDDFIESIIGLMNDEARCLELAENALEYIGKHFNPEACFSELRRTIEKSCANHPTKSHPVDLPSGKTSDLGNQETELASLSGIPVNDELPDPNDYDALTIKIMQRVLDRNSCCVDIGCHMGEILKEMMALAPEGSFYGFEPIPILAQYLEKTYANEKVKIFAIALSDRKGESAFNLVETNPAYSGLVKRSYDRSNEQDRTIHVPVDTIDHLFADTKVDFIKIDVEGGELQVIKGGQTVIARDKPVIVFEHGLGGADSYSTGPSDIFRALVTECGLSIYNLHSYLAGEPPIDESELTRQFYSKEHYYFVAARRGTPNG